MMIRRGARRSSHPRLVFYFFPSPLKFDWPRLIFSLRLIQPQPQERPLRIKRARKPASHIDPDAPGWDVDGSGPGHPSTWGFLQVEEPGPSKEEMISSFRVQTANNDGSTVEKNNQSRRPSGQDLSGNGTAEVPQPSPADNSTTPMDMDTKEPKVESQG